MDPRAPVGVFGRVKDGAGALDGKVCVFHEQLDAQALRASSVSFRFVGDVSHSCLCGDPPEVEDLLSGSDGTSVDVLGVNVPVPRMAVPPIRGIATSRTLTYDAVLLFVVPSIAWSVAPNAGNH